MPSHPPRAVTAPIAALLVCRRRGNSRRVFSGSVDGHLRAYSAATGEIIWDEDTARDYEAVNGQHARGGSFDGPGPVIVDGVLFVNSGYGQWGGMPGNVLLAFSVDGR